MGLPAAVDTDKASAQFEPAPGSKLVCWWSPCRRSPKRRVSVSRLLDPGSGSDNWITPPADEANVGLDEGQCGPQRPLGAEEGR